MSDIRDAMMPSQTQASSQGPRGDFIWYELVTPDPEGAKAFYEAVVGWKIGEGADEYNGYRMIGRSDGKFAGGLLPLDDQMRQNGARPMWLGYIHVPNVDDALAAIEQAGGKTMMGPTDIPNVGRIAMVVDPQETSFYVMTPIPPADHPEAKSDVFSSGAPERVGWNELQTTDVEAAREFYGAHFGWGTEEFMDMGEMGKYRFIHHSGERIGAMFNGAKGERARFRFYIRVPSIAKAKEIAEAKGGTINMGPHEVPTGDWIVIGSDPQGAEFALVGGR